MEDARDPGKATAELGRDRISRLHDARVEFDAAIEPHRPALFRFCHRLTGDPFEAEDLHQETVLRAFATLSERFERIRSPQAYLFQIASRLWIDQQRRASLRRDRAAWVDAPEPLGTAVDALELRDAATLLLAGVPPREAVVLVLRDVFDFSVRDAARLAGCSEAAVKMATTRARRRASELGTPPARPLDDEERVLLDRFVDLFQRRDLRRLIGLFDEHATARVLGCAEEDGRDEIERGSLRFAVESTEVERISTIALGRELLVGFWMRSEGGEALGDLARLHVHGGRVQRYELYYFSPGVITAVAGALGVATRTHGWFPAQRDWWNEPG